MKNEPTDFGQRRKNTELNKRLSKRPNTIYHEGEIVADSFFSKQWFIDLSEQIFTQIKRLKVCTIRQLVTLPQFETVQRYHFINALESLGNRIKAQPRGLFTQYSINEVVEPRPQKTCFRSEIKQDSKVMPDYMDFTK